MSSGKSRSPATISWIILTTLALTWGSSFILIKRGLIAFDPGAVGALRIAFASVFLLIPALRRIKKVKKKNILKLIVVGFFGSLIPSFLFAIAQTRIDSAIAGILNAVTPLWVIIISVTLFSQRISVRVFAGMLLGFTGAVWLVSAGSEGILNVNFYALFVVAATICYGVTLNIIKYKLADLDALTITSVSLAMVGPLAILYLFLNTSFLENMQNHPYALQSLGALGILGVLGTAIALILFNKLVKITTPVYASSVTYLIPIVAVIWGLIDGEILTVGRFAGMALILAGVFIANQKRN